MRADGSAGFARADGSAGFARADGSAGFTLVEVMVALAVLALTAAAVFPQFGGALRLGAAAERERAALLVAQSVLAAVGAGPLPPGGIAEGAAGDGWVWRVGLRPLALPDAPGGASPVLRPFEAVATVGPPDGRPLARLTTVVLGRAP